MKRVAVTFEHKYSTYSKLWGDYYGKYVDNLLIIDTGESLVHDWNATTQTMNEVQDELFNQYDIILFADVDEFLIPDPDKYKDLGEYLDGVQDGVVRATGYNVMEMPGDKPLDFTKPVLEQRSKWSYDQMYSKYVILMSPQTYTSNHEIVKGVKPDSGLVLFHLRDADITSARERLKGLGRTLSEGDLKYRQSVATDIPNKWQELL